MDMQVTRACDDIMDMQVTRACDDIMDMQVTCACDDTMDTKNHHACNDSPVWQTDAMMMRWSDVARTKLQPLVERMETLKSKIIGQSDVASSSIVAENVLQEYLAACTACDNATVGRFVVIQPKWTVHPAKLVDIVDSYMVTRLGVTINPYSQHVSRLTNTGQRDPKLVELPPSTSWRSRTARIGKWAAVHMQGIAMVRQDGTCVEGEPVLPNAYGIASHSMGIVLQCPPPQIICMRVIDTSWCEIFLP